MTITEKDIILFLPPPPNNNIILKAYNVYVNLHTKHIYLLSVCVPTNVHYI